MALLGVVGPLNCSANSGAYVDTSRNCSGVMFLVMARTFFSASAAITGSAVEGIGAGVTGVGVVGPSATPLPSGKSDMGAEEPSTGVGLTETGAGVGATTGCGTGLGATTGTTGVGVVDVGIRSGATGITGVGLDATTGTGATSGTGTGTGAGGV